MTPDEPLVEIARRPAWLVDLTPLRRHRDFRLLWIGQSVTFLGSMITYVAVPFQVYTTIPDHLRGRLAGIELISYSSGPTLGNVEAGGVAALTSPRISTGLGGALCVVGTLALATALPAFRRYDSRTVTPG